MLADDKDVQSRLHRTLTSEERSSIDSDLSDASDIVIGYCRQDFTGGVPTAVKGVVAKMVARVYARNSGGTAPFAEQQTSGPFAVRFSADSSSGDLWLTKADKVALRPHRVGGGMTSVGLVGERYSIEDEDDGS